MKKNPSPAAPVSYAQVVLGETDLTPEQTQQPVATSANDPGINPEAQADREAARSFLENVVAKVLDGIGRATPKVDLSEARRAEEQAKTALEGHPRRAKFWGYQALSLGNKAQGLWNLDQAQAILEANPVENGAALLGTIAKLRKVLSQSVDKISREVRNLSQAAFEIRKKADEMTGKVRANTAAIEKARTVLTNLEDKLKESADLTSKFGDEVAGIATLVEAGNGFEAQRKAEALDLTISLKETGIDVSGCDVASWDFRETREFYRRGDRTSDHYGRSREKREADRARTLATKGPSGGGSGKKNKKKGK